MTAKAVMLQAVTKSNAFKKPNINVWSAIPGANGWARAEGSHAMTLRYSQSNVKADDPHPEEARRAVSKDGQQTRCLCHPEETRFAHCTMISTLSAGLASLASTVARAGALPGETQASHTSFIWPQVPMSVSQMLADRIFDLSVPAI